MKNNKGQALVLFIALLPLILLVLLGTLEVINLAYQKSKILSTSKSIIASCLDNCADEEIKKLYQDNNLNYENMAITTEDNINIKAEFKLESMLGDLINSKYYIYNLNLIGYKDGEEIKYKRGK